MGTVYGANAELKYKNITTATTTAVKAGPGFLSHITINGGTLTGTIAIYDSLAASGTLIGTIAANQLAAQVYPYTCMCETGITIVTSAAVDCTVIYK